MTSGAIRLTKLCDDYDGMLQIEIEISDGSYTATEDFYTDPYSNDLVNWGSELQSFPKHRNHRVVFEAGRTVISSIRLTAFVYDVVGHSAIEVVMDNNLDAQHHRQASFSVYCEPALLNDLGKQICSWIEDKMQEPLVREWKNT
jgi:hypothetical protein